MNINVATWGRLLKKNINMKNNLGQDQRGLETDPMAGRERFGFKVVLLLRNIITQPRVS